MAFCKNKKLNTGIEINYWRIIQLNVNYDRLDAVVTLAGYLSKEARDNGSQPIETVQFDMSSMFHNAEFSGDEVVKNINLKEAYTTIKSLAQKELESEDENERNEHIIFFADATDC